MKRANYLVVNSIGNSMSTETEWPRVAGAEHLKVTPSRSCFVQCTPPANAAVNAPGICTPLAQVRVG